MEAINVNLIEDAEPLTRHAEPLNIISKGDMKTMVTEEINGLFTLLVQSDIAALEERITMQTNILTTAAREKYNLQQELALKKKELESYTPTKPVPDIITIPDSPPPLSPVMRLKADKSEIPYQSKCHEKDCQELVPIEYDYNDYPKFIFCCKKHTRCGYFTCSNFVIENSNYCNIPGHDYDGFAQRMPSPYYNASTDVLFPSLNTTIPDISSTPNQVIPTPSETLATPVDQAIPISSKPPKIEKKKRSYVFKCYEASCNEPEIEGTYFCSNHSPDNQLGHPELFNLYYGINNPIKRKKIYTTSTKPKKFKSKAEKPKSKTEKPKSKTEKPKSKTEKSKSKTKKLKEKKLK